MRHYTDQQLSAQFWDALFAASAGMGGVMDDRIKQMAQEAGFNICKETGLILDTANAFSVDDAARRFAQLVAEDCAKVADNTTEHGALDEHGETLAYATAAAIRARYGLEG